VIAPVSFPVRGKLLLRPPLMLVKGSAAMESLWGAGVAQSASQSLLLDLSLKSRHNPSKTGNVDYREQLGEHNARDGHNDDRRDHGRSG
jgi:hypothetical protein